MEEYNTLERVTKLFKDKGCKGKEHIYDVLLLDSRKYSGMLNGIEYPFFGLVMDFTDEGIGFFHLVQQKFSLKISLEKLVLNKDSYTFYKNEDIESVEVKKFALLDKKRKEIIIKTADGKKFYLYQKVEDDTIPYHNENFAKITAKYEK
ncbi:hypothetical protein IKH83_02325 [Candidatus Saccharibacteria bacterium]|nr:hypothetical protein [Candidatus Saccharibacteria bacterium]